MPDRRPTPRRPGAPASLIARLNPDVTLKDAADGSLAALVPGDVITLGKFTAAAMQRAADLKAGLPLDAIATVDGEDAELRRLVRRLARAGLLEYRLGPSGGGKDLVVIEPQVADYWPRMAALDGGDELVLSRFALMRRRGDDMVLESPLSGALFRLCDPGLATQIASLATPQAIAELRKKNALPAPELLALLLDCRMLFAVTSGRNKSLRAAEGDDNLVLWDFHDLLFHARSTAGRHANPFGSTFPYTGVIAQLPAVRPRWPGRAIDLRKLGPKRSGAGATAARLFSERHSVRDFDGEHPITLAELSRFLDGTARVHSRERFKFAGSGPVLDIAARPYPSGGGAYELELYLSVDACEGLARGFYHYDAGRHALVPIAVTPQQLDAMLADGQHSMGARAAPQILVTMTARFGRVSWKYSSLAYSLILKHVGVVMQTFYIMATDMGLGACAIGGSNIEMFARMTGLGFHVEGPVGQIALGREFRLVRAQGRKAARTRKR